jgi:hypothetical protein
MRPNDLIHAQGCYSSSAPSEGSSAVSTFESRFMLMARISAIRCLKVVPLTSSSTSRYRRMPSRDELPLLESLGELREISPGEGAVPFGAGFVLAFVVLPAFLGCDVEDDVLFVVLSGFGFCVLSEPADEDDFVDYVELGWFCQRDSRRNHWLPGAHMGLPRCRPRRG